MKQCTICKESKSLDSFSKNPKGMRDGHLNQCKNCVKKKVQEWRRENPKVVKERRKVYYLKSREADIKRATEWNRRHKTKRKITKNKWRAKNRELTNHLKKNYLYRKKNAEGSHTIKEYEEKLKQFNGKCVYCFKKKATTKDHVVPLSRGGTNYISNIVPACRSCNSSKRDKLLSEWGIM